MTSASTDAPEPAAGAAGAPGAPDPAPGPPVRRDRIPHPIRVREVPHPERLVLAVLIAACAAGLVVSMVRNPQFRWDTVASYLFYPTVLQGIGWTLLLTLGAMAIAIVLAVTLAIMRRSENPVLRAVSWFYIWIFRGTPIYTQLVFWGLIGVLYPRITLGIPFGPQFLELDVQSIYSAGAAALIGLALNEAAYLSEIVRSGIESVDKGQHEASAALGMSRRKTMTRIVLPQAMRVIVPPLGNETIGLLKTTSLVLAVPFTLDLQFATNAIGNRLFQPIPLLIVAAIWYLTITSVLMVGQTYLERFFGRGFGERASGKRGGRGRTVVDDQGGLLRVPEQSFDGRGIR